MELFDGRYSKEQLLGQGAFSEVWKVKDIQTNVTLALKIYAPTTDISNDGSEMLTHEFALMVNANHENLLRPLFFASCDNQPYLILPYCQNGNIGKMVGKMTEDEAWTLLRDCSSGLAYLHAMNPPILHQDIKPANILIGDNGEYMLTDFGVSTQVKQSLSRVSNQDMALLSAGTISYMAPERFSRNNLPVMANDIYSLGSTIYEMLSGYLPFGNDGGLLQRKGAEIPDLPGEFSPLLKNTIENCLTTETWSRPTAEDLSNLADRALKDPSIRYQDTSTTKGSNTFNAQMNSENVKKTVLGNYKSSEPCIQTNHRRFYISIALAAIILISGFAWYFIGDIKSNEEEIVVETSPSAEELIQERNSQEYEHCMNLFNSNNPDSVCNALNRLRVLADNGYAEAVFQMAYTYAWIPNETESVRRKNLLGWNIDKQNGQPTSLDTNRDAINWLDKSIQITDSADYKSLYWLSFYYLNGLTVECDMNKARQLLTKGKQEAMKAQDVVFQNKIENTLKQI